MPVPVDPSVEDLAAEAWGHLRSVCNDPELVAAEHRFMHETELTGGPVKALRFLPLSGSLPMRQLAARMGCDNSYVTSLIDTLEERGLATREPHPTDRRVKVIALTEQGRELADTVQRLYMTPPAVFSTLSQDQLRTLRDLLSRLDPAGA